MKHGMTLALALSAAIATPLAAQSFSDGFTLLKATRERDGATAERILSNPSSTAVNHRDPSTGEGVLHILVRGRDLSWLAFMLGRGARPDLGDRDGNTPLILAAQIGWRDGAEQLLARGASVNLGNSSGETPLIFAVRRRDLPMVRLLISQRADPNQTDHSSGNSAIDYARQDARSAIILRELERPAPAAAPPR
ncbi:MAG TPA: ankyrin repeat domain-containing protein [Allosphingosinicella sp.]|nr:ankyrin repeat domain-containing protein [Allosphingosinicella sp.]